MADRISLELKEYDSAFKIFADTSKQNYLTSLYSIAKMYKLEQGTKGNIGEYGSLLERAYAQGHPFAKHDLGILLISGGYGLKSIIRSLCLLLLVALWGDVACLIWKKLKNDPTLDDQIDSWS